mmetsp:Transcript_25110/g.47200  ORF Transcript_25110/g.47200 Transcript_25110/m.47200 type:complete len:237 (+) Transcript_25110:864-1574(+)
MSVRGERARRERHRRNVVDGIVVVVVAIVLRDFVFFLLLGVAGEDHSSVDEGALDRAQPVDQTVAVFTKGEAPKEVFFAVFANEQKSVVHGPCQGGLLLRLHDPLDFQDELELSPPDKVQACSGDEHSTVEERRGEIRVVVRLWPVCAAEGFDHSWHCCCCRCSCCCCRFQDCLGYVFIIVVVVAIVVVVVVVCVGFLRTFCIIIVILALLFFGVGTDLQEHSLKVALELHLLLLL